MSKLRIGLGAVAVGVLVGTTARRRGTAGAAAPAPGASQPEVREELAAIERRLTGTMQRIDRDRRRTGALTFAIAVLIVVPVALLAARPDVPDVVIAAVLAADLLAAAVALFVAARLDRGRGR